MPMRFVPRTSLSVHGWRGLQESWPRWLEEVLLVAERSLPMALATAHYTGLVSRPGDPAATGVDSWNARQATITTHAL